MTMTLIDSIAQQLLARGAQLCTAESCTGGLIGHLLTNLSGSSNWYLGGAVTYSNELKMGLLGVRADTLHSAGAVSAEVAEQMALGARQAFDCAYAISVTGIAGPTGGSAEKPVGLTFIGVAGPEAVLVRRFVWQGSREGNKLSSAHAALALLLELLEQPSPAAGGPGDADADQPADEEASTAADQTEPSQEETTMSDSSDNPDTPASAPLDRTPDDQSSATVEARLQADGTIRPLAFVWRGQHLKVSDWGRSWQRDEQHHFLVMTPDQRVWELRFYPAALRWTIHPKSRARHVA